MVTGQKNSRIFEKFPTRRITNDKMALRRERTCDLRVKGENLIMNRNKTGKYSDFELMSLKKRRGFRVWEENKWKGKMRGQDLGRVICGEAAFDPLTYAQGRRCCRCC